MEGVLIMITSLNFKLLLVFRVFGFATEPLGLDRNAEKQGNSDGMDRHGGEGRSLEWAPEREGSNGVHKVCTLLHRVRASSDNFGCGRLNTSLARTGT